MVKPLEVALVHVEAGPFSAPAILFDFSATGLCYRTPVCLQREGEKGGREGGKMRKQKAEGGWTGEMEEGFPRATIVLYTCTCRSHTVQQTTVTNHTLVNVYMSQRPLWN